MSTGIETIHRISSTTHELTTRYGKWQAFREACRLHGAKVPTETAPVVQGAVVKVASTGAGKAQAPPVAPVAEQSAVVRACERLAAASITPAATDAAVADDPLGRAVERLIAAGQATTEAPGTAADPLQRACERLAKK